MPDALLLAGALFGNVLGLGWLALAMDVHWRQVRGGQPLPAAVVPVLRGLGIAGLLLSLMLCLLADQAAMASLVWVMALAAAALLVAFTFTWRPRTFAPLVGWVRT